MKALSSPARSEKFPPPLMMFTRSSTASRSRGRSRASPMFYLRNIHGVAETAQEPSSPKVTCIGQVKIRRSAKSGGKNHRRCWWFRRNIPPSFPRQKWRFGRLFRKLNLFSRCGTNCREIDASDDSFSVYSEQKGGNSLGDDNSRTSNFIRNNFVGDWINQSAILHEIERISEFEGCSPVENGLIQTRCRSTPYRCSYQLNAENEGKSVEEIEELGGNVHPSLV